MNISIILIYWGRYIYLARLSRRTAARYISILTQQSMPRHAPRILPRPSTDVWYYRFIIDEYRWSISHFMNTSAWQLPIKGQAFRIYTFDRGRYLLYAIISRVYWIRTIHFDDDAWICSRRQLASIFIILITGPETTVFFYPPRFAHYRQPSRFGRMAVARRHNYFAIFRYHAEPLQVPPVRRLNFLSSAPRSRTCGQPYYEIFIGARRWLLISRHSFRQCFDDFTIDILIKMRLGIISADLALLQVNIE